MWYYGSNRVPYDLAECESELVAGFITEYSTIYFSLILLTEYANIIALTYLIILVFSIYPLSLVFITYQILSFLSYGILFFSILI